MNKDRQVNLHVREIEEERASLFSRMKRTASAYRSISASWSGWCWMTSSSRISGSGGYPELGAAWRPMSLLYGMP